MERQNFYITFLYSTHSATKCWSDQNFLSPMYWPVDRRFSGNFLCSDFFKVLDESDIDEHFSKSRRQTLFGGKKKDKCYVVHISADADFGHGTHQRLSPMCKIYAQLHNTCDFSQSANQRLPISWNQKGPPCWLLHSHYIGLVFFGNLK